MSGIEVNVFSKIKAPILSLFLDLKGKVLSWIDNYNNITVSIVHNSVCSSTGSSIDVKIVFVLDLNVSLKKK